MLLIYYNALSTLCVNIYLVQYVTCTETHKIVVDVGSVLTTTYTESNWHILEGVPLGFCYPTTPWTV